MKLPRKPLIFLLSLSLAVSACGSSGSTNVNVQILPLQCEVSLAGQIPLTLDGQIPAGLKISWTASIGNVVWTGQGLTATFIAPAQVGEAVITVSFISGTPTPYTVTRICAVGSSGGPVNGSGDTGVVPTAGVYTIAISEVMANPCGDSQFKIWNQYVELYNYGDAPVNVNGLFLFDEGNAGTPDQIVAWDSRSSTILSGGLITNVAEIPPHSFALILSPYYADGIQPYRMPYFIPPGTVILTVANGGLGDDVFQIIGSENGYDTVTLYEGGLTIIREIVDHYGTPLIRGLHPQDIDDDHNDLLPLALNNCESAERINPTLPDSASNWSAVKGGTPGDGPYP